MNNLAPSKRTAEQDEMTLEQRIWVQQQPTFDYMVDSSVIFSKCGKRFECFKDYRDWVYLNDLLQFAE